MQISLTNKRLKEFSSENAYILQANDSKGNRYFAKTINVDRAADLGYEQSLDFNQQILQNIEQFVFKEHFLQIKQVLSDQSAVIFVTEPYVCNLQAFIERQTINQKSILSILDQIIKIVYSIHQNGYWHRNIRAEHFVLAGNVWKLQSLVYSEDYSKSEGIVNQYLWSSKHQAPQFLVGKKYAEEQFNRMAVWNLGCIFLHLILGSHRLSNRDIVQKFKGQPFTMQVLKIKSERVNKFPQNMKAILGEMLHYDPLKRMTLKAVFLNRFLSQDVANHFKKVNQSVLPASKINLGRSVIPKSAINPASSIILRDFSKKFALKEKQQSKVLVQSKAISSVVHDDEFFSNIQQISQVFVDQSGKVKPRLSVKEEVIPSLEQLMVDKDISIRKIMELYKSYHDQSELLILALESIDKLELNGFSKLQEKELKLIIKHSIVFVSLLNLHLLAEGFNQNQNILKLEADEFTIFQNSKEYLAFQKLVNYKRSQRAQLLSSFKAQIKKLKQGLLNIDQNLYSLIEKDFTKTTFTEIKVSYRLIIKYAYDSIREQYNRLMSKQEAKQLAQTAMLVTYCLTVDKLYLKKHIADNFKPYFQWRGQEASNYVALGDFKEYIMNANKDTLIEHSKYVLRRYFNI